MNKLLRLMIAGTHSGVGKTTVTLGLMSALTQRGYKVQGFKVGPDYIDPGHHTAVTGIPSRNLDTWIMGGDVCIKLFKRAAAKADISIIEGVMGLYDGHLIDGEAGSSAHLAKILRTPVILIVDAKGMARSAGAVVLGYINFDPEVKIAGVILNNIGSKEHFEAIRSYVGARCNVPLLGYLPKDTKITIPERHLGLVTSHEVGAGFPCPQIESYHKIGDLLASTVNIDKILEIAKESYEL
ncbi:MAG TPA: cobyrinate a,c-diamide synthase [Candidatus Brocadiia bacterium]|nr:cobyrinate a,c-diamide synthase [Planctomycetota bacterium]MDO8093396.1 cobyrinate a,c-diamide synthase [Candidatus Brocadiales bacterium]